MEFCSLLVIADLATGQVPEHWEKHKSDEMVKLVPLAASDQEYQKVQTDFSQTVPNVTITAVSVIKRLKLAIWMFYTVNKSE